MSKKGAAVENSIFKYHALQGQRKVMNLCFQEAYELQRKTKRKQNTVGFPWQWQKQTEHSLGEDAEQEMTKGAGFSSDKLEVEYLSLYFY